MSPGDVERLAAVIAAGVLVGLVWAGVRLLRGSS